MELYPIQLKSYKKERKDKGIYRCWFVREIESDVYSYENAYEEIDFSNNKYKKYLKTTKYVSKIKKALYFR